MLALVIYILIIVYIIYRFSKKKGKSSKKAAASKVQGKSGSKAAKSPQKAYQQRTKQKEVYREQESILELAKQNVAENDRDALKETDEKWHEGNCDKRSSIDWEDEELLNQVYDLMIVGYSGNLSFDRDFLSEGMDMLNRLGMMDSNPGNINIDENDRMK